MPEYRKNRKTKGTFKVGTARSRTPKSFECTSCGYKGKVGEPDRYTGEELPIFLDISTPAEMGSGPFCGSCYEEAMAQEMMEEREEEQPGYRINYSNEFPLSLPVQSYVWQSYDKLDDYAKKLGYAIPPKDDAEMSGWIATMGDSYHDPSKMLGRLNDKVAELRAAGRDVIVGFAQTGNFSVGYTIYEKAQ